MKSLKFLLSLIIVILLTGCVAPISVHSPIYPLGDLPVSQTQPQDNEETRPSEKNLFDFETSPVEIEVDPAPLQRSIPTPTPTPDPFETLYDCAMEIRFLTGPLAPKKAEFTILGLDYFTDKGDKFSPGKGTGIFYELQRYLILHSSFVDGNALKPMEAEFIRRYFENWGMSSSDYIQGQMDDLIGSELIWICNGKSVFKTRINSIIRLSHESSERLWLEPENLENILSEREGLVSEWIGEITETNKQTIYLGFCGWGPANLESGRYTYFRYLLQFEILR